MVSKIQRARYDGIRGMTVERPIRPHKDPASVKGGHPCHERLLPWLGSFCCQACQQDIVYDLSDRPGVCRICGTPAPDIAVGQNSGGWQMTGVTIF